MKQGRLLLASSVIAFLLLSLAQSAPQIETGQPDESPPLSDPATLLALQVRYKSLTRQLAQLAPNRPYIVVDTARNHLFIKRRDRIMLDALASTGSGTILDKPGEVAGQWIFDTPRGEFYVQSKLVNPVWVKPDWAFVEEGLAVPTSHAERMEPGVLGAYALGFGKGYFIHGTLYPRLLGKNVTHGCIRLNDDDLKSVYQLARVGTPIMIF
jgi:L,D-transpeptidase YbiS